MPVQAANHAEAGRGGCIANNKATPNMQDMEQMPRRVPDHPLTPRRAGRSAAVAGAVKIRPYVRTCGKLFKNMRKAHKQANLGRQSTATRGTALPPTSDGSKCCVDAGSPTGVAPSTPGFPWSP